MSLLLLLDISAGSSVDDEASPSIGNRIWRRQVGDTGTGGQLVVPGTLSPVLVAPNGTYDDYFVDHRQGYEYRVQSIAANGTSTFSDWTS